jgi:tetratricopeptide (TPR) repeat protein
VDTEAEKLRNCIKVLVRALCHDRGLVNARNLLARAWALLVEIVQFLPTAYSKWGAWDAGWRRSKVLPVNFPLVVKTNGPHERPKFVISSWDKLAGNYHAADDVITHSMRVFDSKFDLRDARVPDVDEGELSARGRKLKSSAELLHNARFSAVTQLRAAITMDSANVSTRYRLATVLKEMGSFNEAFQEFQALLVLSPCHVPCLVGFAQMLTEQGQRLLRAGTKDDLANANKRQGCRQRSAPICPNVAQDGVDPHAFCCTIAQRWAEQFFLQAKGLYERALRAEPTNSAALMNFSVLLASQLRKPLHAKTMLEEFKKAVGKDAQSSRDAALLCNLACLYEQGGEIALARDLLMQGFSASDASHMPTLYNLARLCQYKLENQALAQRLYAEVLFLADNVMLDSLSAEIVQKTKAQQRLAVRHAESKARVEERKRMDEEYKAVIAKRQLHRVRHDAPPAPPARPPTIAAVLQDMAAKA